MEDSDEDFDMRRAFVKLGVSVTLRRCVDGDDALDLLHRRGACRLASTTLPSLVLLDLSLPSTDGRRCSLR